MKIVVLAGGLSPERDVSLSSGSLIARALRESGHSVLLLDVYEGITGTDLDYDKLFQDKSGNIQLYKVDEKQPDLEEIKKRNNNGNALIGPNVLDICKYADVVFIALHGAMGENGQLQAVFDVMGINYTGSGYIGSLLAMDKDISKQLMKQSDIPTADWVIYSSEMSVNYIKDKIGLPCVVKPCSAGSSIGVSIVYELSELENAIAAAKKVEQQVLIEKMIPGREFSVGILNGAALPVIEIIPKQGFYDYQNKYQPGLTEEICPANLPVNDSKKLQELALRTHNALRLGSYSRIDFILDKNGDPFVLEANNLPGMTPTSLLPQEAGAAGISYVDLCNRIVNSALGK